MNLALQEIELPLRLRTETPMSDDDFLSFCRANEPTRFERDAKGEILVMSPTDTWGSEIETDVVLELGNWARGEGLGPSAGFRLPDTSVRAADAAWASWDNLNACPPAKRRAFWPVCPEFVIEVRSENERLRPLRDKMKMWLANGVQLAWLIDPERKAVEVYRTGVAADIYQDPKSVQESGPVFGFELVMERIVAP